MVDLSVEQGTTQEGLACQVCGCTWLEKVLDLGNQPLCNEFLPLSEANRPQTFYPLGLCYCPECSLVQLDYVIPTEVAFGDQYTYLTGSSPSLVQYYSQLAARFVAQFGLQPGDAVVEIGSNDGTFLNAFQSMGMNVLGIEGAKQSSRIALANNVPTIERFFGEGVPDAVKKNLPSGSELRLILAMNVLAHTDNINEFLAEVARLMEPNTVLISSSHWLMALIRQFEFDTIYHEHLRYYTLSSLMKLLGRHGLYVSDAEITDFYGGSVLAYASKRSVQQSPGVRDILRQEDGTDIPGVFRNMKQELLNNKCRLLSLLVELRASGKSVVGLGAPMKASTLLNYYGITSDLVQHIGEVNPLKVGTVVPGVRIPVVEEDMVLRGRPDYALILSWNMAEHIMPKIRSTGFTGKFILPVPKVEVIR